MGSVSDVQILSSLTTHKSQLLVALRDKTATCIFSTSEHSYRDCFCHIADHGGRPKGSAMEEVQVVVSRSSS